MRKYKFKLGDRVHATYKNQTTTHYYGEGKVIELDTPKSYKVRLDNGDEYYFREFELELAKDKEIVQFT